MISFSLSLSQPTGFISHILCFNITSLIELYFVTACFAVRDMAFVLGFINYGDRIDGHIVGGHEVSIRPALRADGRWLQTFDLAIFFVTQAYLWTGTICVLRLRCWHVDKLLLPEESIPFVLPGPLASLVSSFTLLLELMVGKSHFINC
jgi:hypothetical protein